MTQQYLVGELSVRLEQLQSVTTSDTALEVACLRHQIEEGPLSGLVPAARRALTLADGLCWDSLSRGDVTAFASQATLAGDLRLFGISARLVGDG
jgi:hypothetical protein